MFDVVSIELAKKLEDKGIIIKSLFSYNDEQIINPEVIKKYGELSDDGYYELTKEGGGRLKWNYVYKYEPTLLLKRDIICTRNTINAPLIIQVLDWFRKEKDIDIVVYPIDAMTIYMGGEKYILSIYNKKRKLILTDLKFNKYMFIKYEDAVIAGINFVIDNLM